MKEGMRFAKEQSEALQYQIYEVGGISHIAPNYEKIINVGAQGIIEEVEAPRAKPMILKIGFLQGRQNFYEGYGGIR